MTKDHLKIRKGRGYYFQRATPKDLRGRTSAVQEIAVGKDYARALEAAGRAYRVCDNMFTLMRATEPNINPDYERRKWRLSKYRFEILNIKPEGDYVTLWNGPANDIDPDTIKEKVTVNVANKKDKVTLNTSKCYTWMDIVHEEKRRNPTKSENTLQGWTLVINKFIKATGVSSIHDISKDAVIKWRDYLQETCTSNNTLSLYYVRTRTIYKHAYAWGWHDNEPFEMFTSRYISGISVGQRQPKGVIKQNKVTDIKPCDEHFSMNKYSKAAPSIKRFIVNWWIMRYTCAHVGEADGLVWEDVDFDNNTICIQANSVRELKTAHRGRELPLLEPLKQLLLKHKRHTKGTTGSIHGLPDNIDRRQLGKTMKTHMYRSITSEDESYSPKKARDWGNTVIKANFKGNPETLYAINGHKRQSGNATAAYGDITLEAKREALELLLVH